MQDEKQVEEDPKLVRLRGKFYSSLCLLIIPIFTLVLLAGTTVSKGFVSPIDFIAGIVWAATTAVCVPILLPQAIKKGRKYHKYQDKALKNKPTSEGLDR